MKIDASTKEILRPRIYRAMIATSALFYALSMAACGSKDSNNGSPATTAVAINATPELKPMRHRVYECPRNILGTWTTFNSQGVASDKTYSFEADALIENGAGERMIFDGSIRELQPKEGMRFWYVGSCRRGIVRMNMWSTNGVNTVKINSFTTLERRRLFVDQEVNGFKVPFIQVFNRKY